MFKFNNFKINKLYKSFGDGSAGAYIKEDAIQTEKLNSGPILDYFTGIDYHASNLLNAMKMSEDSRNDNLELGTEIGTDARKLTNTLRFLTNREVPTYESKQGHKELYFENRKFATDLIKQITTDRNLLNEEYPEEIRSAFDKLLHLIDLGWKLPDLDSKAE